MELSPDIMGTSPKLPSLVDHSWLNVDLKAYDNYPSDNNPVRIVPKLSELWNHAPQTEGGISLIPNATVKPLGVRATDEDARAVDQIVREAKKAVMAGLTGKDLSKHLKARFSSRQLIMATEELKKVAEEVGLLGNVYVDVSAFNSYDEADQFLKMHRNRLARDLLLDTKNFSPNLISYLASSFHKNVVASVEYGEKLYKKYKDHLVAAGRIPSGFVIDSKETLQDRKSVV